MPQAVIKKIATIFLIILTPIALAAAAYGFIWWKVSSAADDFAQQVSPFVDMTYQNVHIDLLGSEVGLLDVAFVPVGMEGSIDLEMVKIKAPSWGYLLDFQKKMDKGEIPESFNLDMQGLTLDMASGYMQDWARMAEGAQRQAGQGYDTLACGDLKYFSIADVRKMGYGKVRGDLALQYYFDKEDKQINFDIQSDTQAMMGMSMSMDIQVSSDKLNLQTAMFAQPQLKRVEMRFFDRGYNVRRNKFCSKLNEEPVDAYRERYRTLLAQRLSAEGWTIPEPIITAFDAVNDPGGSVYVRVDIPDGFGTQHMMMVQKPTDLIDSLSPYVEFNGKPVLVSGIEWEMPDPNAISMHEAMAQHSAAAAKDDASSEVKEGDPIENLNLQEEDGGTDAASDEKSESQQLANLSRDKSSLRRQKLEKGFKQVELPVLANHIGEQVILYTYFGRKVEGALVTVTSSVVTVEHRLVGGRGTATYPIAMDKIQRAELFY